MGRRKKKKRVLNIEQGTDPATDFRGMGLLGLLNLLYFAETRTEKARAILASHREYPFAVAGINITSMLLELMEMNGILSLSSPVTSLFSISLT